MNDIFLIKCQGQKVKHQQNDLITRNIYVKFYLQSTSSLMSSILLKSLYGRYFAIQRYNAMLLFTVWLSSDPVEATLKNPDVESLYSHEMSHGGLQSAVQL